MTEKFLARHTTASLETLVAGKRGVIVTFALFTNTENVCLLVDRK